MPRIVDLDPATYVRHPIHRDGRTWAETNCYCDVVVELLHGLGFEPEAALSFTLTADFELDQWTFFKFRHEDLATLYALSVHELAPWRPLADHLHDQVAAGRPVLVELDACYLPDTAGTAYGSTHTKTTVAVNEIDREARRLGYFHNQGYHVASGRDFDEALQTDGPPHPRVLPPYIEFVKRLPRAAPLTGPALVDASLSILRRRLSERPGVDPFGAFGARFEADLDGLLRADIETFHAYSFATLRQLGACFELAATYLRWLQARGVAGVGTPIDAFDAISVSAKWLQFQLARSVARRRPLDLAPLADMSARWHRAMDAVVARFG